MFGNIKTSILFVLFPLFVNTFQILATPTCLSDIDTPVCVDEVGFYYLLGNGTWNVSLTEGEKLTDRESFLSKLQNNGCPISASTSASDCDNDCCYCVLILNQISYYQDVRQKRPAWSWRNTSAIAAKAEAVNQTIWKTVVDEPTVDTKENISIFTEKLSNGFEYSWFKSADQLGQEIDHVMLDGKEVSNLTVNFSGKTECLSKHRKWDSYLPCSYTVNATLFSECSQLKNAVYVVSRIIYNYISDTSTHVIEDGAWNLNMTDEIGSRSPEGILTCANFPSHFTAVEIWVEGDHLSTVLSFETAESIFVTNELKVTAAVWQHIVTEKDYTNLSKFWTNFYFGDCLFRRCWRDLWNILPENLLRNFVFKDGDNGSFRWGFMLPVLLICFVLIVRANLISSAEAPI